MNRHFHEQTDTKRSVIFGTLLGCLRFRLPAPCGEVCLRGVPPQHGQRWRTFASDSAALCLHRASAVEPAVFVSAPPSAGHWEREAAGSGSHRAAATPGHCSAPYLETWASPLYFTSWSSFWRSSFCSLSCCSIASLSSLRFSRCWCVSFCTVKRSNISCR